MAIEIMMTGQALIDALGNVAVELDEDNFATNAATVRKAAAEIDRLTALVRQTREEAEAAVQRAAEGELAARAEVERLTVREQTLMRVCEELRRSHPGMTHAHVEKLDRLTARLQTAEKAAHEWRERAEGKEDGTRCKSCGGGLDGPGWDCQWCGERAGA